MSKRVSDYALLLGHAWRCVDCRQDLLRDPNTTMIGYKISEEQRELVRSFDDLCFQTVDRLADAAAIDADELHGAVDHPRARLRHLGSVKGERYHISRH